MAKQVAKKSNALDLGKKASKKDSLIEDKDIAYHKIVVSCACGAEFESGSTLESIRVDICSQCHPFFTGERRMVDTLGRVERFKRRYKIDS